MQKIHEEYLTDENGNKKAVIVPISEWQHIKEDLEVLDDIRAYDKAKSKPSEPVPFNEAIQYNRRVPNIYSCLISTKSQNPLKSQSTHAIFLSHNVPYKMEPKVRAVIVTSYVNVVSCRIHAIFSTVF